jgi:hypothetical protein
MLEAAAVRLASKQHTVAVKVDAGEAIEALKTAATLTAGQRQTLADLMVCCMSWQKQVRVLGNVRAGDAASALHAVLFEVEAPDRCDRAPEGWHCSREKGHAGPCAAHPNDGEDDDVVARSKRVLALVDTYVGQFEALATKESRDALRHGLMREFGAMQ